jgi:hypothetical protein
MPANREIGKQQITCRTIEIPPSFYIGNSDQKPAKILARKNDFVTVQGFLPV